MPVGLGGEVEVTPWRIMYMNKFMRIFFVSGTNVLAAEQPLFFFTPHYEICHIGNRSKHHQARDQVFLHNPQSSFSIRGSFWTETQALCSFQDQLQQFDHGTCPSSPACNESKNISVINESTINPPPWHPHSQLSTHGSRWAESEAMMCFRSRLHHFDRGSQAFLAQHLPSTQELIAMTTRKTWKARQKRKDTSIAITAHQLAHAKGIASHQVTSTITEVWKNEKYGNAPWAKPTHSIQIAMENFNSLCVLLENDK